VSVFGKLIEKTAASDGEGDLLVGSIWVECKFSSHFHTDYTTTADKDFLCISNLLGELC
jgi:hypothetical protein